MAWINADGTPADCERCMTPDHFLSTFTITVRSMSPVWADQIKELIEKKFEVAKAELAASDVVVVPSEVVLRNPIRPSPIPTPINRFDFQ